MIEKVSTTIENTPINNKIKETTEQVMIENNIIADRPVESDVVERARGFWAENNRIILIGLGIVLLGVVGFLAYKSLVTGPNETKASEAIFRAQDYFNQDSVRLALNGDNINPGFLKIITRYDGTKAANLAHFYAGSCYLKLGDYNNAVKHLKEFSTDSKQIEARATALLGDAYSELGKKEDAAEQYDKAGKMFEKDDYNSPEYLFRAGYLYESMGKNKEAIAMYKLIKEKYAKSERGFDIDKYLARLGELDTVK
ncbi:MAG: tetratricopeptide repeat protein [Chitinophagaceae bacterium]